MSNGFQPPPPKRMGNGTSAESSTTEPIGVFGVARQMNELMHSYLYKQENQKVQSYLEAFEKQTNFKREQLGYFICIVVAIYFIIGSMAQIICNVVGFAYPAYASVKAIRTQTKEDDTKWLTYWSVFGFFSLVDFFAEAIMRYFPGYWLAKVLFLLYLYLPQTNGAVYVYDNYLDKFITAFDAYVFKTKPQ